MIGVVIVGHGEFAKGINSVIELVVGKQESLELVSFLEGDSNVDLNKRIKEAIDKLDCEETLIFTDLPGGTPFKESAMLSTENDGIEVIAGTNIPMLLEILFERETSKAKELKERAMSTGKEQIVSFEIDDEEEEDEDFGDGI